MLCGKQSGSYYFDDFSVETSQTLSGLTSEFTDLELFPNPASTILNVKAIQSLCGVFVYDTTGKKFSLNYSNKIIDTSELSNGLYMFNLQFDDGKVTTRKIIIKQ